MIWLLHNPSTVLSPDLSNRSTTQALPKRKHREPCIMSCSGDRWGDCRIQTMRCVAQFKTYAQQQKSWLTVDCEKNPYHLAHSECQHFVQQAFYTSDIPVWTSGLVTQEAVTKRRKCILAPERVFYALPAACQDSQGAKLWYRTTKHTLIRTTVQAPSTWRETTQSPKWNIPFCWLGSIYR